MRVGEKRDGLEVARRDRGPGREPEGRRGDEDELLIDESGSRKCAPLRADGGDHEVEAAGAQVLEQLVRQPRRHRDRRPTVGDHRCQRPASPRVR